MQSVVFLTINLINWGFPNSFNMFNTLKSSILFFFHFFKLTSANFLRIDVKVECKNVSFGIEKYYMWICFVIRSCIFLFCVDIVLPWSFKIKASCRPPFQNKVSLEIYYWIVWPYWPFRYHISGDNYSPHNAPCPWLVQCWYTFSYVGSTLSRRR